MADNRPLLNSTEAAKRLGIGKRTLEKLTKAGQIPAIRYGGLVDRVCYDPATLDAYVARQQEIAAGVVIPIEAAIAASKLSHALGRLSEQVPELFREDAWPAS
jgi:excisionase family DNA binding protein